MPRRRPPTSSVERRQVPLEVLPPWHAPAASILSAHVGTTDYLLAGQSGAMPHGEPRSYDDNEEVWRDIVAQRISDGTPVVLKRFQIMDWFPRAPGLYHTPAARGARDEAFGFLHSGGTTSPIRDHAGADARKRGADYTVVFTPPGKQSMLEGGIGAVRLKPIVMSGEPHWLRTATSDGITHTGVPIALPRRLYLPLLERIQRHGAVCATVVGQLEFVPDPFSRLFDRAILVPRLLLRVTALPSARPRSVSLETSVAASFVSAYKGRPGVYATYVTFQPDVPGSFEDAVSWMKTDYVEGEYQGRIITDFDQTRTIFPEAKLALSKVMDRLVSRGELRETVELMHASASVDAYFDEIARRDLLPGARRADRGGVFISYAHAAEKETGWVARIRTHLAGLAHSSKVEVWDDSRIDPGQKWRQEIEQAVGRARVAVLVLTADFLASPFIREAELPLLLEAADADGARILCLYGSAVHLTGVAARLSSYQFVNTPDQPLHALSNDAREAVYAKLTQAVDEALST